jgi:3-deoxy-D-manno-octulosonic-acid transferase
MRFRTYQILSDFLEPALHLWLRVRMSKGKEDRARFGERFGRPGKARPQGVLVWIHAASVGEANSVLPLIGQMRERFPHVQLLLTTGTVTSAQLMASRLPAGVIHQYVPIDTPESVRKFLRHWKPDIGFWIESEFWPNLVITARKRGCFMVVVNGRMSERSYEGWQRWAPTIMFDMMRCFEVGFAQSEADAQRLRALGLRDVRTPGNIKYDGQVLPCDEAQLLELQRMIGERPVWLAASTHPGEEELIREAHALLAATRPNLLTVIVPRHPKRGGEIAALLANHGEVALRSKDQPITTSTRFYVADTLGELGLFYRACEIVFMGGSLVKHGGQNPLEPARLRCAILTGPHTHNFAVITEEMEKLGALLRVQNSAQLAAQVDRLLRSPEQQIALQSVCTQWLKGKDGASARILDALSPIFVPLEPKA